MSDGIETREFRAEARQLLHLMVHSIYSDKDIFLRELISNASDALDKLRLAAFRDKDLEVDLSDPHVALEVDPQARTLTVRDNGIGMSRDEVTDLIGTIAKSGTAELIARLKEHPESAGPSALIGQFGIGFYSTFMVADRVTLVTRKAGEPEGTRWESTGEGTYTIEPVGDAPQGTSVTLHLKPEDAEDHLFDYASPVKLREIVKRYSDFISWPIRLGDETLNSMKALWARPRDEVKPEEYQEFYRHLTHDWVEPLETIHMRAEGTFEYEALLFLPARARADLYTRDARPGIQLYVKRVFIMAECPALLPPYLRFVCGVVDAQDLSLNVSREILQQDRQIQLVRRRLVKKVFATVKEMMAERPEKYATFWREFGPAVKEGLLNDPDNQEAILEVATFASTHAGGEPVTLRGYVDRMPPEQTEIYYITGESRPAIEHSPHLEAFRAKGHEVLLLTDPVDEMWVETVQQFDGRPLRSVAKGEVDLGPEEDPEREQRQADFAPLLAYLTSALADQVKQVRLSTRLTESPACVVGDANDLTPGLIRMYRALGQEPPATKPILELNPSHALVKGLRATHQERPDDPTLPETAELLYGMAVLAEGAELPDPARFAKVLADRLSRDA